MSLSIQISRMRRIFLISFVLALSTTAQAAPDSTSGHPSWREVRQSAKACGTRALRQKVPTSLEGLPLGPAYRLDTNTTPRQRQCFHARMKGTDLESMLREMPNRDGS